MNNNNLFNFLSKLSEEIVQTNDYQQLDFTKKEDVDKLDNAINSLKENKFFVSIFGDDLFNGLQEKVHSIYEESKTNIPKRPSSNVSEKIKNNIYKLANEYVKTLISPYENMNKEQYDKIVDSLFEFACWMYQK